MARRTAGYSSLQRHLDSANSYSSLSSSLAAQQSASLAAQLSTFQSALATFSSHHRQKILSSPEFRTHFSQLCAEMGVDPLGGGAKGLWDKMGVGDWYYALGVQIVDVCLKKRDRGGGLVALDEVLSDVRKLRSIPSSSSTTTTTIGKSTTVADVSESDVQRAIEALDPLGCGYRIIQVGGKKVVRCSPGGLDKDSLVVVEAASDTGRGAVTRDEVQAFTEKETGEKWTMDRVEHAIEKALMEDGMIWIDEYNDGITVKREYWSPALFVME
ncbi:EAP30/Vps36 family vacuolar-sorting protein [Sporobolomyces salmoneus]|uniref:EAP30/Vps36 family vacuolar-sorting protein n=1 Tax=Sporobolomyces salmoneus TaxID=183962 RepID=UPI003178AA54